MGLVPTNQTEAKVDNVVERVEPQTGGPVSGAVGNFVGGLGASEDPGRRERRDRDDALRYALQHAEINKARFDGSASPTASQVVTSAKRFAKFLTTGE